MKIIPLSQAFKLLQSCSALIVEDNVLVYPELDEVRNKHENEFMFLKWEDEGFEYSMKFTEEDNEKVPVVGSSMYLVHSDAEDGEVEQITLLHPWKVETELKKEKSWKQQ